MRVPQSKLHRPRLSRSVIDRTWLFQRSIPPLAGVVDDSAALVEEPTDAPVTLLAAPAGAGKTTLMASWAKNRADHGDPVGWVSLDENDNDPVLLWTSLLAAVHAAVTAPARQDAGPTPDVGAGLLRDGQLPLIELEAMVAGAPRPVWLFVDDVQLLQTPEALNELNALLRSLPEGLHLALATRRDPAVGMHRLRLAGRLREIRATDLALDRGEVRQVLAHHGVTLEEMPLTQLMERTEGWAAGVRLAALTLADATDPSSLVRAFAGDERAVADYLAEEILATLSQVDRKLLQLCAVPEQLTAELAVAVTGSPAAAALLERLYRGNVLVARLVEPSGWYRMHGLLRSYLLSEFRQAAEEQLQMAHARTADWFAAHGNLVWAIGHAIAAGDDRLAARMLSAYGPRLLADGRARILHRLIAASSAVVQADPDVGELAALTGLELGSPPPIPLPRAGDIAEDPLTAAGLVEDTDVAPLRALVALQRARHGQLELASTALTASAPVSAGRDDDVGLMLRLGRGMVSLMAGELTAAAVELESAADLAAATDNEHALLQAMTGRTVLSCSRGDYQAAWGLADETVRLAARLEQYRSLEMAGVVSQAAHSANQRLDATAARNLADRAQAALTGTTDASLELTLTALFSALDVEEGRQPADATRRIRDSWARIAGQQVPPLLVVYLTYLQHRCSWQVGRPLWAREALDQLTDRVGPGGDLEVLTAAEHMARGRGEAARHRLAPVLQGTIGCASPLSLQQGWLIEAVLAAQTGQRARAHEALEVALDIGVQHTAFRAFLDLPGIAGLLDEEVGRFGRLEPVVARIRGAAKTRSAGLRTPLSPKELTVLSDLPSQLTLEEIAHRQHLSVNTVKTHVRAIYTKLEVSSRREAVAVARRRGLI